MSDGVMDDSPVDAWRRAGRSRARAAATPAVDVPLPTLLDVRWWFGGSSPSSSSSGASGVWSLLAASWGQLTRSINGSADALADAPAPPLPPRVDELRREARGAGGRRAPASAPAPTERPGARSVVLPQPQATAAPPWYAARPAGRAARRDDGSDASDGGDTLPGLGTWAGRQRLFGGGDPPAGRPDDERRQRGGAGSVPVPARPAALKVPGSPSDSEAGSDKALEHRAWMWRFTRKWQQEQMQAGAPAAAGRAGGGVDGDDAGGWDDALDLVATGAAAGGLQLGRTDSLDVSYASADAGVRGGGLARAPSASASLFSSMLLSPGGPASGRGDGESPLRDDARSSADFAPATRQVASLARKARSLARRQAEIERAVEERWESAAAGKQWVGRALPTVAVDPRGTFAFVLARVTCSASGWHKLVVRGRAGAEDAEALAALEADAAHVAAQQRLPRPRVEMLGCGTMTWANDDRGAARRLAVAARRLLSGGGDPRLQGRADVARVAAALVGEALPGVTVTVGI